MSEEKGHISVAQGFEVQKPAKGKAFLIPLLEWDYLKTRVSKIESVGSEFQTAGSVLLGVAGTAAFGGLTVPKDLIIVGMPAAMFCWGITIVCIISGIMALFFSNRQKSLVNTTKHDVVSDMDRIERRYGGARGSNDRELEKTTSA